MFPGMRGSIEVPYIVMNYLVMPCIGAIKMQRHEGGAEQIIAGAITAGADTAGEHGIASTEVDESQFRVDGRRLPHAGTALQVSMGPGRIGIIRLRPGVAAG